MIHAAVHHAAAGASAKGQQQEQALQQLQAKLASHAITVGEAVDALLQHVGAPTVLQAGAPLARAATAAAAAGRTASSSALASASEMATWQQVRRVASTAFPPACGASSLALMAGSDGRP